MGIVTTLGDLARQGTIQLGDGYRTKKSEHGYPGFPILRVAEVLDGKIDPHFGDYVSDQFRAKVGDKLAQPHDIVLTTKGTVGRVARIPLDSPEFSYSPQVCFFRAVDDEVLHGRFLYYWFRGPEFWLQVSTMKSQTDMADYLNLADIKSLKISLPDPRDQITIAEFLGALDDKIATNEQVTTAADRLRTEIFLNFIATTKNTLAPLSEVANFTNGKNFTKEANGRGRMVARIAEVSNGPGKSTVYSDAPAIDSNIAKTGDVLFAWSGSLCVSRWFREECLVNQHIFKVTEKQDLPRWLIFELIKLKMPKYRAIAASKATTMGHIQRRHLDEQVPLPQKESIPILDHQCRPLWDQALQAEQESLSLAALRDALLPELISGRLRVKDAETQVSAVV